MTHLDPHHFHLKHLHLQSLVLKLAGLRLECGAEGDTVRVHASLRHLLREAVVGTINRCGHWCPITGVLVDEHILFGQLYKLVFLVIFREGGGVML